MRPIAALIIALAALPAMAQTLQAPDVAARLKAIDDAYPRCMDASNGSNPEWAACGGERIAADEALLNELWPQVYGPMEGEAKKALLAEQRAWITYKDKSCLWWLDGYGREGQVVHYPLCRSGVIEDRIRQLNEMGDS